MIATDSTGTGDPGINPGGVGTDGVSPEEAEGKLLQNIFRIANAKTGKSVEDPVKKILKHGDIVWKSGQSTPKSHSTNGNTYQIADSGSPIRNDEGDITGVVLRLPRCQRGLPYPSGTH
ncbi:MAG: hypothetical protein U5N26_03160 [Candidatus Marinimicrobia bacterium]|nr:hypothetical protein [Candidatus Neomarinimicrobiota bacterium]